MKKYDELFITTTDTVVGIGGPINNKNKDSLYEIKDRPYDKGIIIVVGSIEQARKFPSWNDKAEQLAKEVWPGAVTLVLDENTALRMPDQKGLIELLIEKGPCYLTSANKSGEPAIKIEEAKKVFPEINKIYNFGEGNGKESTIIRVEDGKVLR